MVDNYVKAVYDTETKKIVYRPVKSIVGDAVKKVDINRVGGYLNVYTKEDDLDLHGEWFSKKTDFKEEMGWGMKGKPILINHALDGVFKAMPVGIFDFETEDDIGRYVEGQLHDVRDYEEMLRQMRKKGKISLSDEVIRQKAILAYKTVQAYYATGKAKWSSGALPQSVVINNSNGHIDEWARIEGSSTYTPAEPDGTEVIIKGVVPNFEYSLKSAFEELDALLISNHSVSTAIDAKGANQESKEHGADNANPINDNKTSYKKDQTMPNLKELATKMEMTEEEMRSFARTVAGIIRELGAEEETSLQMEDEEIAATVNMDALPEEEKMKEMGEEEKAKFVSNLMYEGALAKFNAHQKQLSNIGDTLRAKAQEHRVRNAKSESKTGGSDQRGQHISVSENLKYAHLSASDMALGVLMQSAAFRSNGLPVRLGNFISEDYARHMVAKMNQHADSNPYGRTFKSATHHELAMKANHHIKQVIPFKANELDASTLSGQGDEWVGEFYSTDLWERERFDRHYDKMVSKGMWVKTIERGFETAYFPTEGSDPTAYTAPQAFSVDSGGRPETTVNINPFGTGRVSLTPSEIKIATAFTTILEEDSVINVVQTVNRQLNEAALDTRDRLLMNGDTETGTTNINSDGSAPATGLQTPYYIASNGLRKTALAAGRDASNTLNLAQYRLTLASLDAELRQYYERMLFFIDPTTEIASLAITEIATEDVRRTAATIESGRLLNIYGIDVVSNGWIPQTDTDGKVTAAGNSSNRGTILLAYAPYWGCAYKRQVTLETARDIYSGANVYVMSMRLGFVPRGSNAAVESYNVATTAS